MLAHVNFAASLDFGLLGWDFLVVSVPGDLSLCALDDPFSFPVLGPWFCFLEADDVVSAAAAPSEL